MLARVPLSGAADLDAAVRAARAALPEWRAVSVINRARYLFAMREAFSARSRRDLARSVTTEMGKTLVDARAEVARMIEMVECACAIPTTMQGRVLEDVARNVDAETVRQPVGVCAAIVPFNFPAMVPYWFLPFAIGCGNAFILKPSEQVPLTQQIAFEIIDGLGLPDGVVNLVNGGREVVEGILDHPGIDAVSFVGSAPVAKLVYERAAKAGKRVQALGGAKNHMVDHAGRRARQDRRRHHRLRVRRGRPALHGGLGGRDGRRGARPADARAHRGDRRRCTSATASRRGPRSGRSSPATRATACAGWIDRGVEDGARLVVDGRDPADTDPEGAFVGPTILDDVTPDMAIAQEEVFGPVLTVVHADSLDDAIAIINRSRFGNGTSIFTENGAAVRRFRHEVRGGHDRRQHRRRGAGRLLPVQRLEGLLPRRPARARARRGRVLHAQEDGHEPLVLLRPGARGVLRRAMSDDARIRRLEEQVAHLYQHLGLSQPRARARSTSTDAELLALVNDGKKIHAIKRYRDLTGVGLKEAHDAVDELERRYRLG